MKTADRVLVRSPNWLGDAVMALPALRGIRARFPRARLVVAAPAGLAPLFRAADAGVDAVLPLPAADSPLGGWRREASALRSERFDLAVLLTGSFGTALAARAARIPERWGYASDLRHWLLTRAVRAPRRRGGRLHQGAWYAHLVRELGMEPSPDPPRVAAPDASRRQAGALLRQAGAAADDPVVGFAPGAAYGHAKRWPPARAGEVIGRLIVSRPVTCVLVGAPGDRDAGRLVEAAVDGARAAGPPRRLINLIGRTDLPLLMGVLSLCRAFVSNDSGAMHLAAASGVPVTAVFGPTDERATSPLGVHDVLAASVWCRPCHLRECPIDHRCMKRIPAARVFDSVARHLAPPAGAAVR